MWSYKPRNFGLLTANFVVWCTQLLGTVEDICLKILTKPDITFLSPWSIKQSGYESKMHMVKYFKYSNSTMSFVMTSFWANHCLLDVCLKCNTNLSHVIDVALFLLSGVSKGLSGKLISRLPSHKYKPVSSSGKGKSTDKDKE